VLVENNERLLESAKPGGYGYKFDNKGKSGYDSRRGGGARRGGYGGYSGDRQGRGGGRGGYGGARRQGGDRRQGDRQDHRSDERRNVADGFVRQERRGRRGGRQQEGGWTNA
jgi:hypothetical protein